MTWLLAKVSCKSLYLKMLIIPVEIHVSAAFFLCALGQLCLSILSLCSQMNAEVQDELLMLLRSQQRELTELRRQIETMQSSIMAQVEHVLTNHQEQERILWSYSLNIFLCFPFPPPPIKILKPYAVATCNFFCPTLWVLVLNGASEASLRAFQ